ncbi:MAG: RNA polymerase sigma factor [Chthoniobacter sp.]
MSSPTRQEPEILDAPADLLTMAVTRSDESPVPTPAWQTIEEVFAALESPLLLYARRLLGDVGLSEDIVQEAFMKLHAQFHTVLSPQPWLYRTVHNLAVDHQRRASKIVLVGDHGEDEPSGPIADAADSQPLPDEQIARWEGIGLVRLVLETLDERSRDLIRLRFNEDLSYKEIAERTGLTVGHVGYLLHHALKAMALELEKTEVAR